MPISCVPYIPVLVKTLVNGSYRLELNEGKKNFLDAYVDAWL